MAITLLWNLQNLWPFSAFRSDDLRASKQLVSKLNVPDHTKQFIFAFRDPETQSLIYVLSTLNLSERSAIDAQCLIREVRPDAVVVQGGSSPFNEIESEEENKFDEGKALPTSAFGVIKRCFVDRIGREDYESVAGNLVLREIFGTGFHGHLVAAKKAAEDIGSSFVVIDSMLGKSCWGNSDRDNTSGGGDGAGTHFRSLVSSLVPQVQGVSVAPMNFRSFSLCNDVRGQMVKALSVCLDRPLVGDSSSVSGRESVEIQPRSSFETPAFAKSVYPLLEDLHDIFSDLPSIGKALAHVQKMLLDVNRGEVLDTKTVSEVYTFRIAAEGLRIALNNSGLRPNDRKGIPDSKKVEFSELPVDEKSHALFAHAIRSQTDKFKTIVAVVDASALAGLRKHWNTPLPGEVKELVGQLVTNSEEGKEVSLNHNDRKRLLTDKPVVAVGAGATVVLGASPLTKALVKVAISKVPASLKIILSQTQKALPFALGQSKAAAPAFATSGVKSYSVLKTAASAEKIRTVVHSIIASAERTSISAMRTALYEIMRKRKVKPIGFLPWATFGGSIVTLSGLLLCGDGIECAIESLPAAPSIASLGRGIQHLHEASQEVMQTEGTRIQKSIESLINRIKKARDR